MLLADSRGLDRVLPTSLGVPYLPTYLTYPLCCPHSLPHRFQEKDIISNFNRVCIYLLFSLAIQIFD